ncbi:sensor domain-containing protein [Marinomonas sp. SBI22]|uniref:sensor domain-containing protein n=2 Tax=unclassified Marinomonas TaxID=196814 RepID=UPI0007AF74A5|nr:EAL domain-containing protein [Marinomonas sp. SBI22]
MHFLSKWLKSPAPMIIAIALIVMICAWLTYTSLSVNGWSYPVSYHESIKAQSSLFDRQILSHIHEVESLRDQLNRLNTYSQSEVEGVLSHVKGGESLVNYVWFDARDSTGLDSLLNQYEMRQFADENTNISNLLYISQSEKYAGMLGSSIRIKDAGLLFVSMNIAELLPPKSDVDITNNPPCLNLSLLTYSETLSLVYSAKALSCQGFSKGPVSETYLFSWLNYKFKLSVFPSFSPIQNEPRSLIKLLLSMLVLMASLIVFYIYRSRRYEYKIESLLKDRGQSLKEVRTEYSNLFMLSVDGIYRANLNGNLLKANPAYAMAFGYDNEDELCIKVKNIGQQLYLNPKQYLHFINLLKKEQRVIGFEWQSQDQAGRPIWLLENAYLTQHENGEVYYEGFISNVTEKKKAEEALKQQAQMDSLTGLLNRATFVAQMSSFIDQHGADQSAIFFIDLDKFKAVNDQYGHHVGDELLVEFSRRLKACFSIDEMITRLGGDEFAVFLKSVEGLPQLHELADKVVAGMRKPFAFSNGFNFKISASIGISMLDASVKSASEGLKQADMAMYEVKRNGRADFIVFNQGLNEFERRRSLLEKSLFNALKHNEIYINYQPIVCFETGEIKGMEALMRWRNDTLGEVSPAEFIAIAEQVNLINPFSNWLIHHVCHDLKDLISASGKPNLFVSINISPKQLLSDQVCDNLLMSMEVNQLTPKNIKVEITETAIYDQEESVLRQLRRIRSYGVGIYIDDFGTGYSSLERLTQYPFDGLKIDRSFVKNLIPGNSQDVILKASVKMAEMLNLVVVVEGIESHFQYDFFKVLKCEYAQGFLLYKPLSLVELKQEILQKNYFSSDLLTDETIS